MSVLVFRVFADERDGSEGSDRQKERAGHLQPQLMQGAPERSSRGANASHNRFERAVAPGLVSRDPRRHPQLS